MRYLKPIFPCSTPQINTWSSDWIQFYGEHRLGYQLQLALDQYGDSTIYEKGLYCLPMVDSVSWLLLLTFEDDLFGSIGQE